jgi:hypothetical protein
VRGTRLVRAGRFVFRGHEQVESAVDFRDLGTHREAGLVEELCGASVGDLYAVYLDPDVPRGAQDVDALRTWSGQDASDTCGRLETL